MRLSAAPLGLRVGDITLGEEDTLGATHLLLPSDYSPERYPALVRAKIVMSLAGIAIEERLTGSFDLAHARLDIEGAFEDAESLAGCEWLPLIQECQEQARNLVNEHGATIEAMAQALKEAPEGHLEEGEIMRIMWA
jgi:hypothetical protein